MHFLGKVQSALARWTGVNSRSHHSGCAMIITLVIRNGIIALDLINEHKSEAKWFPG